MRILGHITYDDAEFAAFDDEFLAALPAEGDWDAPKFEAYVRDEATKSTYWTKYSYAPSYERDSVWPGNDANVLNMYMFHEHWCGCHRWGDLEDTNPHVDFGPSGTEEESCPRGRFVVEKLWHPSRPDDVLYRELSPRR